MRPGLRHPCKEQTPPPAPRSLRRCPLWWSLESETPRAELRGGVEQLPVRLLLQSGRHGELLPECGWGHPEGAHLGLPARVHHFGNCVDGRGECVELLLEPCDRQNGKISKRVDHLRKVQENILTDNYRVRLYQLILGSGQRSLGVL